MYLSNDQEFIFRKSLLQSINDEKMVLPENWELNKVYRSIYFKYENRGCRDLRFFVSYNDENRLFLDYFFKTDDFSLHIRIDNKGNTTKLENFEAQFGWPVLNTEEETEKEHQRIRLHNQNVQNILISKGLEDNTNW